MAIPMTAPYGPPPAYPPYPAYPPGYPAYPAAYPQPYPYYPMPAPPRPFPYSARQIAAFVVSLVGLFLTAAALLTGWWSLSAGVGVGIGASVTLNYGLFGAGVSGFMTTIIPSGSDVAGVFTLTAVMVGVAFLLAIFPVAFAFLSARPWARWSGAGLAFASGALLVVAPLYFMVALPGPMWASLNSGTLLPGETFSGFWGATAFGTGGMMMQLSWGAGIGWYLSFAAGAIAFVGGALLAIPPRAPAPRSAGPVPAAAVPPAAGSLPPSGTPEGSQAGSAPPSPPGA